ncbi:MAG: hypothetical protein PVH68_14125 [Armatimonadota bacterium]|jgi:hypothetical protein
MNMVHADPSSVLDSLDEMVNPSRLSFRDLPNPDSIKGALVAAVFRDNAQEAMELAVRCKLDKAIYAPGRGELAPVAIEMRRAGLDRLPVDDKYAKVYQRVVKDLAELDVAFAMQVALQQADPLDRCRALAEMCEVLAEGDLPQALAAARKMIELRDTLGAHDARALAAAATALAPYDEEVVAELLKRVGGGWMLREPLLAWWQHHRDGALRLALEAEESVGYAAAIALLTDCVEGLSSEQGQLLAERTLSRRLRGEASEWERSRAIAPFLPARARATWASLEPTDPAKERELSIRVRLDALLRIAEAFEKTEPGTSGPEVAEVRRILDSAPADARWAPVYWARLADIYAYHDVALCKATVDQVVARWRADPRASGAASAFAEAVGALARVHLAATRPLLAEAYRADVSHAGIFHQAAARVAKHGPEAARGMAVDIVRQNVSREDVADAEFQSRAQSTADKHLARILYGLARDAPADTVLAFVRAWLAGAPDKARAAAQVLPSILPRERWGLVPPLIERVSGLEDDDVMAAGIGAAGRFVVLAGDAVLDGLLTRLQAMAPETAKGVLQSAIAAKAERDWEGSQAVLASLTPERRAKALLNVLDMAQLKRRVGRGGM